MPLTTMVASLVCVVAAAVMLGAARGRASRAAHAVVLGVMVVLALGMQAMFLAFACAAVLVATAAVLLHRRPDAEARQCALDVAACAALVALMGASSTTGRAGPTPGRTEMASMHASGPSDPFLSALLVGATVVVLGGWAVKQRRDRRTGRAGGIAAWPMMLGMAVMATA